MESMITVLAFIFSVTTAMLGTSVLAISAAEAQVSPTVGAPPSDANGPLKTTNAEYHFAASVDPDVLADSATEVWARVFWPTQLVDPATPSKKRPLLVFLHGNHGTCGTGTAPRNDGSCQYTNEGTCPAGYVVTPNHEGYNYVAETLASWGYIVVSVNANRGITCGGGNSDDWGLILARGRLVLRHLQLWNEWSTSGGAPSTLGTPDLFKGVVDLTNVGLMGHSRGGEGVRAALNLYRDPKSPWVAKIPGLDIRAIYEIGAVDGQSNRVLDAPSVAWNQTLPLCDGDVSDLEGRMPFERMLSRFSVKSEAETRPSPKSLTMVWGANHNYFNTEWQTSDSLGCSGTPAHKEIFDEKAIGSPQQQSIARQSMTAFFRAHVGPDREVTLAQNFDPAFDFPTVFSSVGTVDRDFISGYELAKSFRVDDFTAPTGMNPAGPKNDIAVVSVTHDTSAEPPVANIAWTTAADANFYQLNFKAAAQGADVSAYDYVDLRVGHAMADISKELANAMDFSLQLVASDDTLSNAVAISGYSHVTGPPNGWVDLTQTVRVPFSSFSGVDLKKIRGVRLVFNKTAKGKIRVAHVRFGVRTEKMTPFAIDTFASLIAINKAASLLAGVSPVATMDTEPAATTPADMILPAEPRATPYTLTTPMGASGNIPARRASWMKPRKVMRARELQGAFGYEISVSSAEAFPVMDALPVLNIENHLFPLAKFPSSGETHVMIFTMTRESFMTLPQTGRAQIQYGINRPSRVWILPDFQKSEMLQDLNE